MAHLYLTEKFRHNYQKSKHAYIIESALDKIRNTEDISSFITSYKHSPLWKLKVGNNDVKFRLIIQKIHFDIEGEAHVVLCLKDLIARANKEYNKKPWKQTIKEWLSNNPIDENDRSVIEDWLRGELKRKKEAKRLEPLDRKLNVYTSQITNIHLSDSDIYESEEWTIATRKKELKSEYKVISELLIIIHEGAQNAECDFEALQIDANNSEVVEVHPISEGQEVFRCCRKGGIYIVYAQFSFPEEPTKITFLFDVSLDKSEAQKALNHAKQKYNYSHTTTQERLLEDCRRAYDDYMLYDEMLWAKIQQDDKANLVLSVEERGILKLPTFPMFINGQAGSGKSTVLYYLFAHFYSLEYQNPSITPNCLFFTYNTQLLERGKKNVAALLQHNYKYASKSIDISKLPDSFYTLHDFIKKYLLSDTDKEKFVEKKYMTFSKFKKCYLGKYPVAKYNCTLPNKSQHSPDLVWHIIRTYIKGQKLEEGFTLSEYRALQEGERSVSDREYQDVFDSIWTKWYSKFADEFWDDQDLIRYVLQRTISYPQSPVIFCDEIQDFTRIELDFIWKLSSFTNYDLSGHQNIPFAFAGDPNQTVHPTGFQWNTLKEDFRNKFEKLHLYPVEPPIVPLYQNYRSDTTIVKFSNLIQYFRYTYLEIKELRPQTSWQKNEGFSPCIFIIPTDVDVDVLKEIVRHTTILIPTSRSEEEYIQKNSLLSQITPILENEENQKEAFTYNVMSVATAKGLEYNKVVLYNFGDHAPDSFLKCIENQEISNNEKIELIHFFSKLYVAVSRASQHLFIIDTERGYANFWKYFMTENLSIFQENDHWQATDILPLSKGIKADMDNIKQDNPQKIAQALHEKGMAQKDPSLLFRAQQYYQSIALYKEALESAAWANWYNENWSEAGNNFLELENFGQASNSFWKAKEWLSLKDLHQKYHFQTPPLIAANYMLGEARFYELIDSSFFKNDCSMHSESWNAIVQQLQKDFEALTPNGIITFKDYASYAEKVGNKGFKVFFDIAAFFYFKDKMYIEAAEFWEKNHDLNQEDTYSKVRPFYLPTDYYTAKEDIAKSRKERIHWLDKLQEPDRIISISDTTSSKKTQKFDIHTYRSVFNAYLKAKKFEAALTYPSLSLEEKTERLLNEVNTLGPKRETEDRKKKIFQLLLKKQSKGAKLLIAHVKTFKSCFDDRNASAKILKNKEWKKLLNAYQTDINSYLPEDLFKGFLSFVIRLQWSDNTAFNETLKEKFGYVLQLIDKRKNVSTNKSQYEKLFRIFILHPFGIQLLRQYGELFRILFHDKTTLRTVLGSPNWRELLTEFEQDFTAELHERYIQHFIDIVGEKLNTHDASLLPYTFQLIEQMPETDKLILYVKLINAVPNTDSAASTKAFSNTLKHHLITIVKQNSSTQALSPDSSKPE